MILLGIHSTSTETYQVHVHADESVDLDDMVRVRFRHCSALRNAEISVEAIERIPISHFCSSWGQ